jgi:hypothetical protein
LLYASFRPHLAAVALAFSLALHLHQVGRGTCTPKLLSMPSTQLSTYRRERSNLLAHIGNLLGLGLRLGQSSRDDQRKRQNTCAKGESVVEFSGHIVSPF